MGEAADLVILGGSIEPIAVPAHPDRERHGVCAGRIAAIGFLS